MRHGRTTAAAVAAAVVLLIVALPRSASPWSALGAGTGASRAITLIAGPVPTASASATDVDVSWQASSAAAGLTYAVRRYPSDGGAGIPASGTCAGILAATSCRDASVPAGSWRYAITVVLASWRSEEGSLSAPVLVGGIPPVVTGAVALKSLGGSTGYVMPGATFAVYANVAPSGSPITSTSVDASALVPGATAVALSSTGGPWSIDGISYALRSTDLTVPTSAIPGSMVVVISATDADGDIGTRGAPLTVDATAPTPADVQTQNAGQAGRIEEGDTVVFTFSEPIDPASILAGWTGQAVDAVVRFIDGGTGSDSLTVYNGTNTSQLRLGTIVLGASNYVYGAVDFGSTGTRSRISVVGSTIVVTLGTPNMPSRINPGGTIAGTMSWTPRTGLYDRAGNACPATTTAETGTADRDF